MNSAGARIIVFTPVHSKLSPSFFFPFFFCRSLTQNHHSLISAFSWSLNNWIFELIVKSAKIYHNFYWDLIIL